MKARIIQTLILLYHFIKNPFGKPIENMENDKGLVFIASVLSGLIVIFRFLNTSENTLVGVISLILGLLLTPLLGVLIVRVKGAIFDFYLKYIASRIVKHPLNNILKAKQIATFSTMGLIVSTFPLLSVIGIIVGLVIEILGLQRLFKIELKKAIIVSLIYHLIYFAAFRVIIYFLV